MERLRNRVCLTCTQPIWFNTFLQEWFHSEDDNCALAEPAPIKRKRRSRKSKLLNK